jgi:hypothetical protein
MSCAVICNSDARVIFVECACAQLVRDELMALMCLARSTDAGGIHWPGDLADKKGLPLDRVAAFLTRISNFIPLDDLRETLPSELARHLASPVKKTAQEALPVAQEASGSPAQLTIKGLVNTEKEITQKEKDNMVVKAQKEAMDKKRENARLKYTSDRMGGESPTIKRSDTASVQLEQFVKNLEYSFQETHTGQQVLFRAICCILCALCCVCCGLCAVCCVLCVLCAL